MTHPRWILVALFWVAFLLNYIDRQAVFSIFPALERELGFTSITLSLVGTVFIWTYSIGILAAGRLADILSRPAMVLASLVLWSLAMLGSAHSHSTYDFLFWRGAMGITEALYFPAATALIAALHTPVTRSRALAIHGSAQLAGSAAGGGFGGWSADHIGWRTGFSSLAWCGVGYAVVLAPTLAWLLRHVRTESGSTSNSAASAPREVIRSQSIRRLLAAF